jgi:hypothetical protein
MSNLLSTAKQILIERAQDIYNDRRTDLERDLIDYQDHYKNLGALIFQIDSYKSLGDIINDIEKDNLSEIGYWEADEDVVEDFLKELEEGK